MDSVNHSSGAPGKIPPAPLSGVNAWVFDLDNTLYPPASSLFDQVDRRIGSFVQRFLSIGPKEARRLQKHYFRAFGTTLNGLIQNHGADASTFLAFVHDIDFSAIQPDPGLRDALARLNGRKFVFTNADVPYAERVMNRLGVLDCFDAIFDIAAADFVPKPNPATYERLVQTHGIEPRRALMVDDIPRNLVPAGALGMTTAWIRNDQWTETLTDAPTGAETDFDHVIDDLTQWLDQITAGHAIG